MFVDDPRDTKDLLWTTDGLVPRSSMTPTILHDRTAESVVHRRSWLLGDRVVRQDVWVEVLVPLLAMTAVNECQG